MDYDTGEYRRPVKVDEKKPKPDEKVFTVEEKSKQVVERKYDDLVLFFNVPF
jgi:hypothetical protein